MRKSTDHDHAAVADDVDEPADRDDDTDWLEKYPSETIEAAPVTKGTAGVTVTRYDLSGIDEAPIIELDQHYPPEDDAEGETVWVQTDAYALQLAAALVELTADSLTVPELLEEDSDA